MTNRNLGRWLLVALAIIGLAFAAPAVSAHVDELSQGNETVADEMPADGDTAEWATRMDGHMAPNDVDEMGAHMGVNVDIMTQDVSNENHTGAKIHGQGHSC